MAQKKKEWEGSYKMIHPVFIQAIYYGILMIITIAFVGVIQKGFFFKYLKVRLSFGKYVLVKIRSPLRDYYSVGWVEDAFLVFKNQKSKLRLAISSNEKIFYRCLSVNWIDIDEEKNAIAKTDYSTVTGYDAKKFSDLLTRALMRPTINSTKEKLIIVLLVVAVLVGAVAAFLAFNSLSETQALAQNMPGMISNIKGTVVGGSTI